MQVLLISGSFELAGKAMGSGSTPEVHLPLPIHARDFLAALPGFASLDNLAAPLKSLLRKPAAVSRMQRLGLVGGCLAAPLFVAAFMLFGVLLVHSVTRKYPDLLELQQCLFRRDKLPAGRAEERRALEVYVSAKFGHTLSDSNLWSNAAVIGLMAGKGRETVERFVQEHPNPTPDELAKAKETLKAFLEKAPRVRPNQTMLLRIGSVAAVGALLVLVAIPALIASVAFRGGAVFHLSGLALVTKDGSPASREPPVPAPLRGAYDFRTLNRALCSRGSLAPG